MAKTVKEVLQTALAAFGPNGENWRQGTPDSLDAPNCCVNTSFWRIGQISHDLLSDSVDVLLKAGDFKYGEDSRDWNDEPGRTWPEVKELFEKAIAAAAENGPECRNCGRYLSGHANYNYCFSWGNEKFEPIAAVRP